MPARLRLKPPSALPQVCLDQFAYQETGRLKRKALASQLPAGRPLKLFPKSSKAQLNIPEQRKGQLPIGASLIMSKYCSL